MGLEGMWGFGPSMAKEYVDDRHNCSFRNVESREVPVSWLCEAVQDPPTWFRGAKFCKVAQPERFALRGVPAGCI